MGQESKPWIPEVLKAVEEAEAILKAESEVVLEDESNEDEDEDSDEETVLPF